MNNADVDKKIEAATPIPDFELPFLALPSNQQAVNSVYCEKEYGNIVVIETPVSGLGSTHLLAEKAISDQLKQKNVCWISPTNWGPNLQHIDWKKINGSTHFFIDDFSFYINQAKNDFYYEELFRMQEHCLNEGGNIFITLGQNIDALLFLQKGPLKDATKCCIQNTNEQEKMQLLMHYRLHELDSLWLGSLSQEVMEFVAKLEWCNTRAMLGFIKKLHAHSLFYNKLATIEICQGIIHSSDWFLRNHY